MSTVVAFYNGRQTVVGRRESVDLLGRYTSTFGQIVERERAEAALLAAKQDAEAAERRSRIAMEEAQKANNAKTQFLANMSHELRTPLNAIIGFSEMMAQQVLGEIPEVYRSYAEDIRQSGDHLLSVVNDILDIARIEAGHMEVKEDTFDLVECVDRAVAMIVPQAQQRAINIETAIAPGIESVIADQTKLRQVLVNILGNAVKFTPEGGHVSITVDRTTSGVTIAVTDTGIGIAETDIGVVLT